jgi:GDPmannose 4,6-dehydratase
MAKKVALVVGITGMDGESAAHFLLSKGYTVIGSYRKNTQLNIEQVSALYGDRVEMEYCEITDLSSVRGLIERVLQRHGQLDEVYLLAAQSHVGNSFDSEESTVVCNGMSVFNFLDSLRHLSIKTRLYFAATSELLGGDPSQCPFTEESPYECRSPYSIGKELGTRWVKYFVQTYGMFACYGILFNHSGTSRGKSFFIRKLTNAASRIALGKEKSIPFGNLNFARDEHWSDFGVEMMWKMMQRDKPETYLICRGECHTGEQFLDAAFGHFNLRWQDHVKTDASLFRPNEVVKLVGDPSKAVRDLGWRPNRMSFKDHMRLMCEYDFALESGLKPVRPDVFMLFP